MNGRQTFVKALEPFVNWLEEAEEEEKELVVVKSKIKNSHK